MDKLEATFRIVTPMFMGGADQNKAELRIPSIKGALRFWYRAIYPQELEHEARLFGGTDIHEGQAKIQLRLSIQKIIPGEKRDPRWAASNIPYLGYGLFERLPLGNGKKQMTARPYIKENSLFTLTILLKPPQNDSERQTHKADIQQIKRTLWAMTMFGGLGARSRKGFGSIVAVDSKGFEDLPSLTPTNIDELNQSISSFLQGVDRCCSSLPESPAEFSCICDDSRFILTGQKESALSSLTWLADSIHSHRSFRGRNKLPFATEDHNSMRNFIANGILPPTPPRRTAFGLPHNYFFTSINGARKGGVDLMDGDKKGRRASPVLFKIHEFSKQAGSDNACAIATFLPARLVPADQDVHLSGGCDDNGCAHEIDLELHNDFSAVTDLLDVLVEDGQEVPL